MRILDIDTIRRLMADRKISQVARQTGIHQNTLYRVLSGKSSPSYGTLKALSEYLTATPEETLSSDKRQRPRVSRAGATGSGNNLVNCLLETDN